MSKPIRRVAILTHRFPQVAAKALAQVFAVLAEHEVEVLLPAGESAKHTEVSGVGRVRPRVVGREEVADADLCLVLGGDGSMLRGLNLTKQLGVPVAGVNLGNVGFLAGIAKDDIRQKVTQLLEGEFEILPLLGLATEVDDDLVTAVNDIVVTRARDANIARISYALNGVPLFDARCDGLIVSTPAGSSAYNLASGGPLLGLGVAGYVLTYIAPHSLAARSVVASSADVLLVRNESPYESVEVQVDGRNAGALDPQLGLEVWAVPDLALLAVLPGTDYYAQFRERFI